MTAIIAVIATSTRSRRRKSQPSRSSCTYVVPAGRSSSGLARMEAVDHANTAAQTPKEAASTTRALTGPTSATRKPARAAPPKLAVRSTAEASPVVRSRGTAAWALRAGTKACLAPSLAPRMPPATATSASSAGKLQCSREVQQGDHPHDNHAQQVAGDRNATSPQAVDHGARQRLHDDQRQQLGEGDQAGLGGPRRSWSARATGSRSSRPGCRRARRCRRRGTRSAAYVGRWRSSCCSLPLARRRGGPGRGKAWNWKTNSAASGSSSGVLTQPMEDSCTGGSAPRRAGR